MSGRPYHFIAALAVLLSILAHAALASANVNPVIEEARASSEAAILKLERMRSQIDRKTLSLDNMAAGLDYDPESAVSYVGEQIGFLPYAGSMRGEVGTMVTGSGSVLDQALLLGGLLDVMGLDVAFAFGELTDADTDRLMQASADVRSPESAIDTDAVRRIADRDRDAFGPVETAPDLGLDMTRNALMKALSRTPAKTDGALLAALRQDMREHYVWVLYRDSAGQDWTHAHPAFGSAKAPSVTPARYGSVTVPDGREHEMQVTLSLTFKAGTRERSQVLVSTDWTSTASLAERQMNIVIAPMGLDATDVSGTQAFGYAQTFINGETLAAAKAFSPRGEIINASTANSAQSAVAAQSLFGDAGRALGKKSEERHITGIELLIAYSSPLSRTKRRRVLRDLSHTKPGDVVTANDIMTSVVIDISLGQTNMARVTDRVIDNKIAAARHAPFLMTMARTGQTVEGYSDDPDLLAQPSRPSWPAMAVAQGAFTPTRYDGQTVVPMTAQVSTMMRHVRGGTELADAPALVQVMDLALTDAVVMKDGQHDALVSRKLGVQRTLYESLLVQGKLNGNPLYAEAATLKTLDSLSAVQTFAKAKKLSPVVTARLADDVKQSGLVMVAMNDLENPHWWRLDKASGEALGMSVHGGATATEYAFIVQEGINNAISAAFGIYGMWSCNFDLLITKKGIKNELNDGSNSTKRLQDYKSCMMVNAVGAYAGGGIGKILSKQKNVYAAFNRGLMLDIAGMGIGNEITKGLK